MFYIFLQLFQYLMKLAHEFNICQLYSLKTSSFIPNFSNNG